MKKIIIIIITLLLMNSCTWEKKDFNSKEEIIVLNTDLADSLFNSEFCKCVYEYIQNTKKSFGGDLMYYSVYFFSKDNIDYFTIWIEYSHNKESVEYNDSISNYIKINDIDVLVVGKEIQLSQCSNLIQEDSIYNHFHTDSYRTIYSYKELYEIETYRYSLQNGKYVLNKLEFPIIDFFK